MNWPLRSARVATALTLLILATTSRCAEGESMLSALKLDVLCRGGHASEKLERHRLWCDGYARGVRDSLSAAGAVAPTCVPVDNQKLWDRFGAWLVANPDLRNLPARQAVLESLRRSC